MSIDDHPAIPASVARLIGDDRVADLGQAVSAFRVIGLAEVVLRNALDEQLRSTWGDWIESADLLVSERAREAVHKARERAARGSEVSSHESVRAQLNLGFWVYLLSGSYEQRLWVPSLRHAFPELRPARRSTAFRMAHRMLVLRNRIAHHEPITRIDIRERLEGTLTLLSWIDPELAVWTRLVTSDPIPSPWGAP
jgi:hypothetical protein